LVDLNKYENKSRFQHIESNVYRDVIEESYVFAITYEIENEEDSQYPLEDILDEFNLYVSDFIDENRFNNEKIAHIELAGELEDVRKAIATIVGKRVYNIPYTETDGMEYRALKIE
jgi:hypothetical protein